MVLGTTVFHATVRNVSSGTLIAHPSTDTNLGIALTGLTTRDEEKCMI